MTIMQHRGGAAQIPLPNSAANPLPSPFPCPDFRCQPTLRNAFKPLIELYLLTRKGDFSAWKCVFSPVVGERGPALVSAPLVFLPALGHSGGDAKEGHADDRNHRRRDGARMARRWRRDRLPRCARGGAARFRSPAARGQRPL